MRSRGTCFLRTPAGFFQALIKIYVRLVIAQSIQLSNIVLADSHQLTRLSRYGSYLLQKVLTKDLCTILKSLQPNVRRQATCCEP
jgi:hypothetical protein